MARLLGPTDIRLLAERLGVTPSKRWGQNFVVDAGTVRRVVRIAGVGPGDHVVEVGPGLGSLTLALLESGATVTAVEIDRALARALRETVADRAPEDVERLVVITNDALVVGPAEVAAEVVAEPTSLVANLPYNVSVPVILHALEAFPSVRRALVMVQAEVADRIVAPPGSRTYGIPSAKVAWYASARRAGDVGRSAFWPVPRVDSALVLLERRDVPSTTVARAQVFRVIDAAFAQRRKGLRGALAELAGGASVAEAALRSIGLDPLTRGETLGISEFVRLTEALWPFPGSSSSGTVEP